MDKRTFLTGLSGLLGAAVAAGAGEASAASGAPPPGCGFVVRFASRQGAVLAWRSEGVWCGSSARAVELGRGALLSGEADAWEFWAWTGARWEKKGGGDDAGLARRKAGKP